MDSERMGFSTVSAGARELAMERLELVERLAARGLSVGFREVIGGRVLELQWRGGRITRRWLEGAEAAAVLAAAAPLSLSALPDCLLYDLYLPGFRGNHVVQLAGQDGGGWSATSLRSGVAWMEATLAGLQAEPDAWVRRQYGLPKQQLLAEWGALLAKMRACREQRLLFRTADCLAGATPQAERLAA